MFKEFLQDIYAIYSIFMVFVFQPVFECVWVCLCQVSYRTRLRHTHSLLTALSRSARYWFPAGEDRINVFSIDRSSPWEYGIERARLFVETLNVVSLWEIESLWICCQWRSDGVQSDVTSDNTQLSSSSGKHVQVTLRAKIRKCQLCFA